MLPGDFLGPRAQSEDVHKDAQPPAELAVPVPRAKPAGTGGNGHRAHGEQEKQLVPERTQRAGRPQGREGVGCCPGQASAEPQLGTDAWSRDSLELQRARLRGRGQEAGRGLGRGRHSLWGPHTSPCGGLPSTLPTSTAISWQEAESCPLRQDPWSLEPPAPVSHPASAWPPQFRVRAGTVVGRAWSSLEPSSACVSSSHTCSPTCSLTCRQVLSPGLHARLPPPHPAPPSANCLPTRRPPGRPGASARHRKTEQAGG